MNILLSRVIRAMYILLVSIGFLIAVAMKIYTLHLKRIVFLNLILLLCLSILIVDIKQTDEDDTILSRTILFDDHWQFSFDRQRWDNVTLPHTPRLEPIEKVEQQWQGLCFYRKKWNINPNENLFDYFLQFDGAMHEADVWINKEHVGQHLGGYLPFQVPIPSYHQGVIDIAVELKNTDEPLIPPGKKLAELDFNYYGGLYRHVWLIKKWKSFYLDESVSINYFNVSEKQATMIVQFRAISNERNLKNFHVQFLLNNVELIPSKMINGEQAEFLILNPRLWSPSTPNLYKLTIQLVDATRDTLIYDQKVVRIGIRSFEFDTSSSSLYINGKKSEYIVGTNRHQEYPWIGYALSDGAQYRDAYKIKQAGFTLVRCSHYPPSPSFLDACDELGLLVINAIPGWQYFGSDKFQENVLQDIREMIKRDYHHPSIVLWEISLNESPMSEEFMFKAHQLAKQIQPNLLTCGWIDTDNAYDVFIPARQHRKAPEFYRNYRAKNNKMIFLGEYGDWEYFATEEDNFNQINVVKSNEKTSRQRRQDGEKGLIQQAKNFQEAHNDNRRASETTRIFGDANWLMFDYKRGYAVDIESSGIMDIHRLPKFAYYFYQSQCRSCPPMIFIANYWMKNSSTEIIIYSNCEEVKLRLNDQIINDGRRQNDQDSSHLLRSPFVFHIDQFTPGRLEAIGYNNGQSVVQTVRSTPHSIHHHLGLEVDLSGKSLTTNDVVLLHAYIYDQENMVIPDANDFITFSLDENENDLVLIGENPVRAEAGIATILLKTNIIVSNKSILIKAVASTVQQSEKTVKIEIVVT